MMSQFGISFTGTSNAHLLLPRWRFSMARVASLLNHIIRLQNIQIVLKISCFRCCRGPGARKVSSQPLAGLVHFTVLLVRFTFISWYLSNLWSTRLESGLKASNQDQSSCAAASEYLLVSFCDCAPFFSRIANYSSLEGNSSSAMKLKGVWFDQRVTCLITYPF